MKKKGFKIIGSLLVITGLFCIAYPFLRMKLEKHKLEENLSEWDKKREEFKNLDDKEVEKENNYVELKGEKIVGKIIVKEGLEIPILKGATDESLKDGAGLYDNGVSIDSDKGNAVILGHREVTFRFVEDIKVGEVIEVQTIKDIYRYEVVKTYITTPEDMSILDQTKESSLTLVTCYPFRYIGPAPERFIVKLVKVG